VLTTVTRSGDGDGGAFTRALYTALAAGISPSEAVRSAVAASAEGAASETSYRAGAEFFGVP
jgi:hypothetical protein